MTNPNSHPSDDQLLDYANGTTKDRQEISAHIDYCKECADFVFAMLQAELVERHLPVDDDPARTQSRVSMMKRVIAEQAKLDRNNSKQREIRNTAKGSEKTNSGSQWGRTFLGALGGLAAGSAFGSPEPVLGGHDRSNDDHAPIDPIENHDDSEGGDHHDSHHSAESSHSDVTDHRDDVSLDMHNAGDWGASHHSPLDHDSDQSSDQDHHEQADKNDADSDHDDHNLGHNS